MKYEAISCAEAIKRILLVRPVTEQRMLEILVPIFGEKGVEETIEYMICSNRINRSPMVTNNASSIYNILSLPYIIG